ncbi:MAG: endolytic transglycosylase MltG, partial [Vicinamibacterales bacterium]
MKKVLLALGLLALLTSAAGVVAYRAYRQAEQPFQGYAPGASLVIEIPPGTGPQAIGRTLVTAGIVRDERTYRIALWRSGLARRLQAGEYRFETPLSALDVIGKIARGEVDLRPLTFPEGLTIREMAGLFETAGFGTAASFTDAARNAALIRDLDPQAEDLEGYLFPDTYSLSRKTDAPKLVDVMVERFRQALTPAVRAAAEAQGLSVRQLVTLASIGEKETGRSVVRSIV